MLCCGLKLRGSIILQEFSSFFCSVFDKTVPQIFRSVLKKILCNFVGAFLVETQVHDFGSPTSVGCVVASPRKKIAVDH